MFTGIIETVGRVTAVHEEGSNRRFAVASAIAGELSIDQSLAHHGVCLTVVACDNLQHEVVAVKETLERSNLAQLTIGDHLNLERALRYNDRLDGHIVQGHVDGIGVCEAIIPQDGSWLLKFHYPESLQHLLVDKGSICINGVSLTVISPTNDTFSVAIIPYTWEHTAFKTMKVGDEINLEFDILGKYVSRFLQRYSGNLPDAPEAVGDYFPHLNKS